MIETDKPNPFQILELPTNATRNQIAERGGEKCDLAETNEQRLLYRWAMEQLITNPDTRLEYELFEMPDTEYKDEEWERFVKAHRRNPVDLAALIKEIPPPRLEDFDLAALIQIILDGILIVPEADIKIAVDNSPFRAGIGVPPLEVRDVIFG